jgi:hypothetical protein
MIWYLPDIRQMSTSWSGKFYMCTQINTNEKREYLKPDVGKTTLGEKLLATGK